MSMGTFSQVGFTKVGLLILFSSLPPPLGLQLRQRLHFQRVRGKRTADSRDGSSSGRDVCE